MPAWFEGQQLITPQAAVFIDDTALAGESRGGSGDLCIIGVSQGGTPMTPLYFTTPNEAARTLLGGDGLRAVLRAFSVAPQFVGAPRVIFIRANAATQSSYTLKDGATNNSIVLTSSDYGTPTNLISVQVNTGSDTGRKLSLKQGSLATLWTADNVTRQGFSLGYNGTHTATAAIGPVSTSTTATAVATTPVVGSGTPQSIQVTSSSSFLVGQQVLAGFQGTNLAEVVTITAIADSTHITGIFAKNHVVGAPIVRYNGDTGMAVTVLNAGADVPAESIILPFAQFQTVQNLVDAFNGRLGIYTAALLTPAGDDLAINLDAIAAGTTLNATPVVFTMDLYACLLAFNTSGQPYVTAAAATGATAPPVTEPLGTWHFLSGAADGNTPPTTTDWNNALSAATTIECSVIVPASGTAAVHALFQAHVDEQSTMSERHERVLLVGGVAGETVTQVRTRASALRDIRTGLVYPGIRDVDATNPVLGTIVLDPWLVAAQLGGMFCGGGIAEALTGIYLRAQGVETAITNSDRDLLQIYGIIPIQLVQDKGVRCVHSISTWIADSNFRRNELSTMRASDFLAKQVREALDPLVGRINSHSLQVLAKTTVESTLNSLQGNSVIVGDSNHPAYRNIQISSAGDVLRVSFEAAIAIPANFIEIRAALFAFSGTL